MRDILDLDRYPLDQPQSTDYRALLARCADDLARAGMFNLPGFLREASRRQAVEVLAPRFETESFRHERSHNIYFRTSVPGLAPDHPALAPLDTSNNTLCGDQLAGTALDALYEWPAFAAFLAETMDMPALFPMEDRMSRLNVMRYGHGEALNWHFDRALFTTTLLLQAPEAGGAFEYAHELRSDSDPNYDGVAALLEGRLETRVAPLEPGTLNVFRGRNTAHRVTPSQGARPRIIAVFSYYDRPGVCFSDEERLGFYGRVA